MAKPYEYTEKESSRSNLLHTLNIWGADGWEYCDKIKTENDSYWVLLKRPIMDSVIPNIIGRSFQIDLGEDAQLGITVSENNLLVYKAIDGFAESIDPKTIKVKPV